MKHTFITADFLVLGMLSFFLAGSSCNLAKDREKVEKLVGDSIKPERAEGVVIKYSDSGELKAVIFAPVLERYPAEKPYSVMSQGVNGYFYGTDGTVENSLKANHAVSYEKEKYIEVTKDVRLTNKKNERLKTEKLIWDQKTQRIYTDAEVVITTPDNVIRGTGLESNQNFSEYRIFNPVGDINVEDDEKSD